MTNEKGECGQWEWREYRLMLTGSAASNEHLNGSITTRGTHRRHAPCVSAAYGARKARFLACVVSVFLLPLGGCSYLQYVGTAENSKLSVAAPDARLNRVFATEGMKLLGQHKYEEASRIFNAGLKFAPSDPQLHFLNGLAYHLLYLGNKGRMADLAVAGYELALNSDPAHYYAALQLGRLQFEAKRYGEASEAFHRAIDIDPRSGDAYLGLAGAAYYEHDVQRALAAAEKAAEFLPKNSDALRALAVTNAATGNQNRAQEASMHYAVLEDNPRAQARLSTRLEQWNDWLKLARAAPDAPNNERGAKAKQTTSGNAQTGDATAAEAPPQDSAADPSKTPAKGSVRNPWYKCNEDLQAPGSFYSAGSQSYGGDSFGGYAYGNGDEDISPEQALPSPCYGVGNPPMVVLDVAIIRTEDLASTSYGVNLLENLKFAFGTNTTIRDITNPDSTRDVTITRTRQRGTGAVDSLISYSLNIANATDNRSEVLARPSLVALDRMPSTFFSGRTITVGTGSDNNIFGGGTISDKPVGVGLAVTPTFINDDTIALAVRVQRSFIEDVDLGITFKQVLQTSRSAVSAKVILKMGQTVILSGMSEQETQRKGAGVPVLRDIPVLQYLFSNKTTQNFTSSVLVLITPRKPSADRDLMEKTIGHIDTLTDPAKLKYRPLVEKALKEMPGAPNSLEETYRHAYGNKLFLQFRSGDLVLQHWSRPSRLDELLKQLGEALYF